jgi:secretion/DNA translocation related TadE-like protein
MLAGIAVVVLATAVAIAVGIGTAARHRAQGAADAAALAAAADALAGQPGACVRAKELAVANGAHLDRCAVANSIADVTVSVPLPGALGPLGPVAARARAGPASVAGGPPR